MHARPGEIKSLRSSAERIALMAVGAKVFPSGDDDGKVMQE